MWVLLHNNTVQATSDTEFNLAHVEPRLQFRVEWTQRLVTNTAIATGWTYNPATSEFSAPVNVYDGETDPDGIIAPSAGLNIAVVTYTQPGSYTYNAAEKVNAGVKMLKVTVTAGGGGGGGTGQSNRCGQGGGSGGTAVRWISAEQLQTAPNIHVVVGNGGIPSQNNVGQVGTLSSFGSFCSATGGAGGAPSSNSTWILGQGGTATGGNINLPGGAGHGPGVGNGPGNIDDYGQSNGAASYWGAGPSHGNTATAPGTGGSGRTTNNATAGTPGIVVIEEYY